MSDGKRGGAAAAVGRVSATRYEAIERILATLLPFLQRWAHGRLPAKARRRMDTGDVVQEAVVGVLRNLGDTDLEDQQAVARYLAIAIRNRVTDEVRRSRQGEVTNRTTDPADPSASPLELAIDAENQRRYREALGRLCPEDQSLLVGRIELGLSFEDLALVTQRPSADAARVATRRAALRLARAMGPAGSAPGTSGGTIPE